MTSPSDKRVSKREKSFIITYIDGNKGYITDVSDHGCQIFLEGIDPSLKKNSIVEIKIEISEYNEIGQIIYSIFNAKIVWIQALEDFTIMGLYFEPMDEKQNTSLKKIIHYWNFLNSTFG